MILTDSAILSAMERGEIKIEPFDTKCLGSNSYDVHLGKSLGVYKNRILDAKKHNQIILFDIREDGYLLQPGFLYLGVTQEYTESLAHVPFLDGKSSGGRLGLSIHITAGKGDVGFKGHWTLEMTVVQPVRIYAGMPIGQLFYFETLGKCLNPYNTKQSAKYNDQPAVPVESMMFKNFEDDKLEKVS